MSELLPKDWSWKPLGELAEVVSGGTPSKNEPAFWEGGTIPWATPSDITKTPGRVLLETGDKITDLGLSASAARKLPIGSVLMTSRATLGEARVAGVATATNQGFKSLIPKVGVDSWYLFYQIQNSKARYSVFGKGTTFLEVNTKDTLRLPIPHCAPPQQRRIATILTTMDEVIEATEKLVEKHQQIKAGLMHDLFTRGLWTRPELARGDHKGLPCEATAQEGQLRPTPAEAPGLYQDSPIGLVPKEWDVNELRNWLSYLSYGFTNPMPESEDGPYMVTAADVTGGGIQYETCRRTTRIAYERLLTEKSRPKLGDVLLTKDGTLGRIAVVERDNVCINQSVAVLRPANPNHSKFLAEMLNSPRWQQKMIADAGGSTIKHIYITVIDKMLVGWPVQSSEVEAIVAKIDSANKHLGLEKLHLAKLRQQKQGLMHDLLTGRVRVDGLAEP